MIHNLLNMCRSPRKFQQLSVFRAAPSEPDVANSHTTFSPSGEAQDDKTSVDPNTPSEMAATVENQQIAMSQSHYDFSIHEPHQSAPSNENQHTSRFPDNPWPFTTDPYFPWPYQASSGPTGDWYTEDTIHFEHSHGLDGTRFFHETTVAYGPYQFDSEYLPQYHPDHELFY